MIRPRAQGFSYIELLIVTAIIGVLYLIMYGPGSKFSQERSKAKCAEQLSQLHMVLALYAGDHQGAYPFTRDAHSSDVPLSDLVPKYTADTSMFICPGSRDSHLPDTKPFAGKRISYGYCMGVTTAAGAETPVLMDDLLSLSEKHSGDRLFASGPKGPGTNHRDFGGNVLYADGHVETGSVASHDWVIPRGAVLLAPKK